MSIVLLYQTGSIETITAPDLSYSDGFVIQSEYVDMSNLDRGIFWDRNAIDADHSGDVDSKDPDEIARALNPFGQVHQRVCVAPPETLQYVEAVYVKGTLALVRDPRSPFKCGLLNVLVEEMRGSDDDGIDEDSVERAGAFGFSPADFPEEDMPI